ncbi:MAG: hypothetical protein ACLFSI_08640 [Halorhodospira sp.]
MVDTARIQTQNPVLRFLRRRATRLLLLAAAIALTVSVILSGEPAFLALLAFTILLPATIVSLLVRWWPSRIARRDPAVKRSGWRQAFYFLAAGVPLTALICLVLGVGAFGTAVGIVLLTTGLLLLPPSIIFLLLALSMRFRFRIGGTAFDPKKQLGQDHPDPGERVIYQAEVHWGVFLPALLALVLSVFFAIAPFGIFGQVLAIVLYVLVFPGIAAYAMGIFFDTELWATPRYLIAETGLIAVHSRVVPRHAIQALGIYYSWLGLFLGYGWVVVVLDDGSCFFVPGIVDPEGLRSFLESQSVSPYPEGERVAG